MKLRYNSPVILSFTIASTLVLIIDSLTGGNFTRDFFVVYPRAREVFPSFDFRSFLSYLRLFSHVLGHADWMHLIANFSFILLIGPILEEKYGSNRVLAMIVITAFITGVLNVLVFSTALMGASGIVFMLILLSSFTNIRTGEIPITFVLIVALFLTKEIVNAVSTRDNISQFAHIIGGICGALFGFAITHRISVSES